MEIRQRRFNYAVHDERIYIQRQMRPMLFNRCDRQHGDKSCYTWASGQLSELFCR
jgi:hypothetical protein